MRTRAKQKFVTKATALGARVPRAELFVLWNFFKKLHKITGREDTRKQKKGVCQMSGNTELLNFVYQNSQMGIESLSQLIELSDDEEFKECMEKQLEKYRECNKEARRLLEERGHNEKSIGMFDRLKTYLMINLQTMNDKSASHMAQMLIEGSSMGVTNALQDLRKYEDADTEILRLMRKLYKFEEKNVETYKAFL